MATGDHPGVSRSGLDRKVNGVSVIIASYRSPDETLATLGSLGRQTLDRARFEVILVVNGPQAERVVAYKEFAATMPELQLRLMSSPLGGACHALNLGIGGARMPWLTFVDDDDTVSPRYLEGLLRAAAPGQIPLALIDDVYPDGSVDTHNRINDQVRPLAGLVVPPEDCPRALTFNASKLIPTDWAQSLLYDTGLASGQDIAFYAALYARYTFHFAVVPEEDEAVYLRLVSDTSQSRRELGFEFSVEERLDVIESVHSRLANSSPAKHTIIDSLMRGQAAFVRRFLDSHPDRRSEVNSAVRTRGIESFPWEVLTVDTANTLVISICFPPYSDPSAVTVAKRMVQRGDVADVVTADMSSVRRVDDTLHRTVDGLVDATITVETRVSFAEWASARAFSEAGWDQIIDRVGARWPYERLYSRAMWPASHVLATLVKARVPATHWIAEFSDPLSRDVEGRVRRGRLEPDDLVEELMETARTWTQIDIPTPLSLYELAELLPYAIADELVFTNEKQLEYMMSYCESSGLTDLVREKAVVAPHPILPREFYDLALSVGPDRPGVANLAYFGGFYPNRSIQDVLAAVSRLPDATRRKVAVDVYTDDLEAIAAALEGHGLAGVVTTKPTVGYLEFLNLTTKYDCLIVEDTLASTSHGVNPYLPSKWSDYRGSGTPIWAIVDQGSTLSRLDAEYTSRHGSIEEAEGVLEQLLATSGDSTASSSSLERGAHSDRKAPS